MLPTAPVPAAPARLDPLLMPRSSTTHLRLGAAVCDVRVLLLGLSPLTAAAAVMLAGCGVRGFTVADDGWVTWADARAGSFDSTEVGLPRDLCTRRRIRAANALAAPVTWTDDVLTDARPGRVVLRASRLRAAAQEGLRLEVPGDHLRLPDGVPLVEVLQLPELAGLSAAVLEQTGAWHRRPCQQCLQRIAEHAHQDGAQQLDRPGPLMAMRAAAPAHTAWAAGMVVQAVLAAALEPEEPHQKSPRRWLLGPGHPLSTRTAVSEPPGSACDLCRV